MTLLRATLLSVLAFASTLALAADPKLDSATGADSLARANIQAQSDLDLPHLVPWFTGRKRPDSRGASDRILSLRDKTLLSAQPTPLDTCLKLRAYIVKRQETFSEGESALVGYWSCQRASKFHVHSAVQTIQGSSH